MWAPQPLCHGAARRPSSSASFVGVVPPPHFGAFGACGRGGFPKRVNQKGGFPCAGLENSGWLLVFQSVSVRIRIPNPESSVFFRISGAARRRRATLRATRAFAACTLSPCAAVLALALRRAFKPSWRVPRRLTGLTAPSAPIETRASDCPAFVRCTSAAADASRRCQRSSGTSRSRWGR